MRPVPKVYVWECSSCWTIYRLDALPIDCSKTSEHLYYLYCVLHLFEETLCNWLLVIACCCDLCTFLSHACLLLKCWQSWSAGKNISFLQVVVVITLTHCINMEICLNGNVVGHINKVTLRWVRLVLRWVTVHKYTILVFSHTTQASSACPSIRGGCNGWATVGE